MKRTNLLSLLPWVICALIATFVGLYFRLYPLEHNTASDAYEQARVMVVSKIRATITEQVSAQAPDMPSDKKQQLIQARLNELMRANSAKVRAAFDQVGIELAKKEGEKKHYLQESDSYYFLDLTQNILEEGDVSSRVNGSQYFNNKMLAPIGYWEPQTWHPYIGAWVYKAARSINPGMDLMTGLGFTPLVLFPFVLFAFLMACRALGCGWPSAFTASIFFVLAPIFLQRSTYGWYDNDTYSVLFPVLNLGLLFFSLRSVDNLGKTLFWGTLAGISFALYARFWSGWSFSWGISLGALAIISTRAILFKESGRKNILVLFLTIIAVPLLCLVAMIGLRQFMDLIPSAFGELKKFTMHEFKGWPDLFIVVGELHATNIKDLILLTGGPLVISGAAMTYLVALKNVLQERRSPPDPLILLGLFTGATAVLGISAERFTILLLTPMALSFALGLDLLWQNRSWFSGMTKLSYRVVSGALLAVMLSAAIIPVIISDKTIASLLHPIFNSAWDRALTQLRDKTPENSVINTWWSPGHFVKAVAKRRVTFDGASIKGEQAYWLTQVYLSQSETQALGILRMLNTSSNKAVEFLQQHGWPLSRAVPLIKEITSLPKEEALRRLNKELPRTQANEFIKLTHAAPPPSYVLIYQEIVEGNVLLGYVGKWDFSRIEALNKSPAELKKVPAKSSRRYIDFLWDLVGGQLRQSETLQAVGKKNDAIFFDQGVILNTTDMSVIVNSPKFGRGIPKSIVYFDTTSNHVTEKMLDNATLGYSAVIFNDKSGTPSCVLMDRMLANSLIIKMYYFEGKGLEHFKPFAKEQDLTGQTRIFIYQVNWPRGF
jgi:asparagine N-glycosylation enzyme membrane subunit Stt3